MSELPTVRLRALTAADIPRLRCWGGLPERYLGIEEMLEAARVPDTSLRCFSSCGFVPDDDALPGGYAQLVRGAPGRSPLTVTAS
jgi:hypothetical protein